MSWSSPKAQCVCLRCGQHFETSQYRKSIGEGKYCSKECWKQRKSHITLKERFESKLGKQNENGCIPWTGTHNKGYAIIHHSTTDWKPKKANRVAWELYRGPIPEGMCVCHTCDNPGCLNIEHLFLGTQADNVADKVSKGRQAKGEKQHCAKLTAEDVLEIRRLRETHGTTISKLAEQFGVDKSNIAFIINRKTWKHI